MNRKLYTLAINMLVATALVANPGGVGDQNTDCITGHTTVGPGSVWFDPSTPATVRAGDTVHFKVWVNVDAAVGRHMVGVMLLTGDGRIITQDGWRLLQDPNGNTPPYNYNEKDSLNGNTLFEWVALAPSTPGNYTVKARSMYGDNGRGRHNETQVITFNVTSIAEDVHNETPNVVDVVDGGDRLIVRYSVPYGIKMSVSVYDFVGRELVKSYEWRSSGHGTQQISWGNLPDGLYIAVVRYGHNSMSFKIFHIKGTKGR